MFTANNNRVLPKRWGMSCRGFALKMIFSISASFLMTANWATVRGSGPSPGIILDLLILIRRARGSGPELSCGQVEELDMVAGVQLCPNWGISDNQK